MKILTNRLLLFPFLAIGLASCITDGEPDNVGGLSVGNKLPEFSIETDTGKFITTSDFSDGKGVIILFNTSCGDCQRELPLLQPVYEQTRDKALWIAIAREENTETISKFWDEHKITIPYSPQPDRKIFELFASIGIPRVYISDNSVITHVFDSEHMPSAETLLQLIIAD